MEGQETGQVIRDNIQVLVAQIDIWSHGLFEIDTRDCIMNKRKVYINLSRVYLHLSRAEEQRKIALGLFLSSRE